MKIKIRLIIIFSIFQMAIFVILGLFLSRIISINLKKLVFQQSQQTVFIIADTIKEIIGNNVEKNFEKTRQFIFKQKIGDTGFYFVLNGNADYIIHKNKEVEGQNWLAKEEFIKYIMENKTNRNYFILAISFVLLDQITKILVKGFSVFGFQHLGFNYGESISVIGDFLHFFDDLRLHRFIAEFPDAAPPLV